MRLLLDTHIFIWFITADPKLSQRIVDIIRDPENEVFLSVASVWESTMKYQLGKLNMPESPEIFLPAQREIYKIQSLLIDEETVKHLPSLPSIHRDPFDRIMICQALNHQLTFVTADGEIQKYPVPLLSENASGL
jgi:PIN domain nuclease of toxin-antitoxin system